MSPSLDIAILTAGNVGAFHKCLTSLLGELQDSYKVYVHNNGHPSKEYEEMYKLLPPNSVIRRSNQMLGFSEGANIAINNGSSSLILFITDDVFITSGVITSLLKRMQDPSIGQCGYKLLFPIESVDPTRPAGKVQHVGMASTIQGDMIHPLIGWSPENPKCNISREVLAVTGASFMIRRDVFNLVGGFDPSYGVGYYEDVDLSFKIRAAGFKVFVETAAVAYHGVGQTFKNYGGQIPFIQNQQLFKSRWLPYMPWSEWEMW